MAYLGLFGLYDQSETPQNKFFSRETIFGVIYKVVDRIKIVLEKIGKKKKKSASGPPLGPPKK